jgi:hypothetical protein
MSNDLNLSAYSAVHRIRRHGMENGYVEKTGKRVKKWRGYYHDYRQQPDGTQKRIKLKTILGPVSEMNKAQAEEALRVFIRRRNSMPVTETPQATVATLCDDYLALHEGDWEDATRATNNSILTLIKAALGERAIEAVEPDELKRFINSLPKRTWKTPTGQLRTGCSESQAEKCITYARAIFDLAAERAAKRGVLFVNPACSKAVPLTVPARCRKPDKTILPPQELPRLMKQLNEADQLAVWLAAVSLRPARCLRFEAATWGRATFVSRPPCRAAASRRTPRPARINISASRRTWTAGFIAGWLNATLARTIISSSIRPADL